MIRVVLALCAAEVATMVGVFAFPTLLPVFMAEWGLSNTQAGWISGIGFAGYAAAVPVLSALTDRIDARRIYLGGALLAAVSCLGFAFTAEGFASALAWRALAGIGLAGTYMPGLRALVDRTHVEHVGGPRQAAWISWYTASFSLGTSVSFLVSGVVGEAWGWRAAFAVSGLAALAAAGVALALKPVPPPPATPAPLLDFRPVLRNRRVLGYTLAYGAHVWELFGMRSWMVAFLIFAAAQAGGPALPSATLAATLAALLAMGSSIGGASLAARFDRRTTCSAFALMSAAVAGGIGFTAGWPYGIVVALMLLYNLLIQLDSAALTTGAVLECDPKRRGATMAVHSLLGFAGAFAGPLAFGAVLDLAGGQDSRLAWGLAFASLGVVAALGAPALAWSRRG
ncbi:nitrate/nitrite transporter [Magnetospirillum sp. UT-4]|uniref:MFS transporter n=1 Tax=Magnetospirillum sp. UT-4 TaxID=2681467 RepID=UPI00137C59A1|nr:MFS transporter [Magnetospirillum sp. UT-4]CAA7616443.1 Permease of the major facilitator superfamily [Magnetospirillum sp. UT-4]